MRIHSAFFCTEWNEFFDYEKVAVYFILYSSASPEEKICELYYLLAIEMKKEVNEPRVLRIQNDPKSGKLSRIFGYMIYLACQIAIENVLRDETRRRQLGK